VYYLFLVGTFIAIISYPIQGLKYGLFYPLSVIYHIGAEPFTSVPVTSQEVINPLSLIYKIINGFEINRNVLMPSKILSFITSSFIILFILSNILAGYI
jgi:hypothetical protein